MTDLVVSGRRVLSAVVLSVVVALLSTTLWQDFDGVFQIGTQFVISAVGIYVGLTLLAYFHRPQ